MVIQNLLYVRLLHPNRILCLIVSFFIVSFSFYIYTLLFIEVYPVVIIYMIELSLFYKVNRSKTGYYRQSSNFM